jgi:DNA-binding NarL/FixJ family response regulator
MPRKAKNELPEEPIEYYRIVLVEDHAIVRTGIRALLASQPDMAIVGEAASGLEAVEMVKRLKPDLVILDLSLPEMDGLQVLENIRKDSPDSEILVLTMHFSEDIAREALRIGAIGFVLKSDADEDLLAAVDNARHKQSFFTGALAASMADNFVATPEERRAQADSKLTPREIQVITLLGAGRSNKEVAAELKVSTRTIESHRHHIMHKMKFASFSDLIKFAVRNKLVDL